jgi:hypothetical protein
MTRALFILGHAGSGKTQLAKKWVKDRIKYGEAWCIMDKDTTGEIFTPYLMEQMGLDKFDRDSSDYKLKIRDLEYHACLNIAKEQLNLGVNVVLPGPWSKEIANNKIFSNTQLGFPEKTQLRHLYFDVSSEKLKERILLRNNKRDEWKLNNWDEFKLRLNKPQEIIDRNIVCVNEEIPDFVLIKKIKHLYKII